MRADEISNFFAYEHLPPHLQNVSQPFHDLAVMITKAVDPSSERTLALRKLWESKNYAVWCAANTATMVSPNERG